MTSETIQTLNQHVTMRDFSDKPLDDETLMSLLEAARRSPTSSNWQTYSLVVVRDQQKKQKLHEIANRQKHVLTAPVFIAICADVSRTKRVCEMHSLEYAGNLENSLVACVDAAIVGMSLTVAAESIGLGAVMIGAMRNDPIGAAKLLNLPDGAFVLYGLCLGWPASRPPQKPRLPQEAIVHFEEYNTEALDHIIHDYDAALAEHYRSLGRETPDAAWTETVAQQNSSPRRPELKQQLETLGFMMD